jgi:predicted enzyme related to lactoylglutathione lyase
MATTIAGRPEEGLRTGPTSGKRLVRRGTARQDAAVAVARFEFVTIDAVDPDRLATFWSEVLDTPISAAVDEGRFVFLKGGDLLPVLCFQRVPEGKTGKSRMHLDLAVGDLDEATAQIVELGGSWTDGEERRLEGVVWRTMTDPEGNEFDITSS